jgi:hypothetical protein
MNNCKQYITETKIYVAASQTATNCNSLLFINTGLDPVNIDGLLLQPNQSWAIDGNFNEMLIKVYDFKFTTTTGPQLTIIYKRYLS